MMSDHATSREAAERNASGPLEWLVERRRPFIVLFHVGLVAVSGYSAIWLRFDGGIPNENWEPWPPALPGLILVRALTFAWFGLYEGLWRYTGIWDLRNIVTAVFVSSLLHFALVYWAFGWTLYPRGVFIIDSGLLVLLMGGVRMTRRMVTELWHPSGERRVLVYGAGDAGEMIVRDMRSRTGHPYQPVGFIDDDRTKTGLRIHGVPVLGTREDLPRIIAAEKPDEVLIAIPRGDPAVFRKVVRALERCKIPIKTLPSLREILDNKVEVNQIRELSVQDLLSRGPVGLDPEPLRAFLVGRRVMVTGAGGSIGSELSRQIAAFRSTELVLFDQAENSLFHIGNELADRGHDTRIHSVVGDITDRIRVEQVLKRYQPEIVFHAAARKHVPLMEANACEAVKNNVTGTRLMAEMAERWGADRFVLISTDKAVNPTSVMGATKRVGELLLQTQGDGSGTTFVTVRFGNVLASSGSVVPRFVQQIKAGGPVTVTHPEMRRFFMLIPEAVQLVLHAAAAGENGCVYVLEMGEQVRLVDMARDLIRLAGFVPDTEIPITFSGIRPGEKLSEELFGDEEVSRPSSVAKVMSAHPLRLPERATLLANVARLEELAQEGDAGGVIDQLSAMISAFAQSRARASTGTPASIVDRADVSSTHATATSRVLTEPGQKCPACGSDNVHRSRAKSRIEEARKSISHKRLYRCGVCNWRGWLVPIARRTPGPATDAAPAVDLAAIDESMVAEPAPSRPAFAPRNLRVP
jgi:FlaA1/EpsC-like NDP-sugar epimerase